MRVDQLLHWLCLTRSRSLATRACREGRVRLNGHVVRAAHEARVGDRVALQDPVLDRSTELELIDLPGGQVSRREAHAYYRFLAADARRDAP